MYETAVKAIAKQRVALEVMSYHAMAPMEEAERLKVQPFSKFDHTIGHAQLLQYLSIFCLRKFLSGSLVVQWLSVCHR